MKVLRAVAILILLLGGGCGGGGPSWSTSFDLGPATAETRLSVRAWRGRVRLRNSTSGRVEVTLRGEAPIPLEKVLVVEGAPLRSLGIGAAAKGSDLEVDIAAPAGICLSCACDEASVEVSGAWARLEVSTGGGTIAARTEAAAGALKSQRGAVSLGALGAGPTGEMRAESTGGDVSVTLPAAWNGQLKLQTRTGKLDVASHANLQTIWDENKKGVVGRMGPPREKGAPLATVWGVSGSGDVSFRVGE